MAEIPSVALVHILPMRIWIESDLLGARHVMVQHEGLEAFTYATFNHNHCYTSNSGTFAAAEDLAIRLGATRPVEMRNREFSRPSAGDLRKNMAALGRLLSQRRR